MEINKFAAIYFSLFVSVHDFLANFIDPITSVTYI